MFKKMQRRIFIAIDIDPKAKKFIAEKLEKIEKEVNLKLIDKDNYHITISFLGFINDDDLADILTRISGVADDFEIFDISLNKVVPGPSKENPKMIWLTGEKNEKLINLRHKLEKVISGIEVNRKEFVPHVNLGKIKNKVLNDEFFSKIEKEINLLIPVTGIKILESRSEKGGVKYFSLDFFEFK